MCLAGTAAAGMAGWKLTSRGTSGLRKHTRTGWALGTQVNLTVCCDDRQMANEAMAAAFAEIERVETVMSLYRADSQVSQLNRDGELTNPHPWLTQVLRTAGDLSARTDGAFDITVQPLWNLYSGHANRGTLPSEAEIREALARVGWERVQIGDSAVRLNGSGTQITLNGIAQGFAADMAGRALQAHGIHSALIDTGEIGAIGAKAGREAWSIGIKHPRKEHQLLGLAALSGRCLSTSGDYESRFSKDFSHHHLLNPKTGHSANELASVSVAAPTALEADALSTAVFLLGLERGRRLIETTPGTDALFVTKEGNTQSTSGFPVLS